MKTHTYAPGINFRTGINLPILGSLSFCTQPHMWYTDLEKREKTGEKQYETI
jgi:hypothetical protein